MMKFLKHLSQICNLNNVIYVWIQKSWFIHVMIVNRYVKDVTNGQTSVRNVNNILRINNGYNVTNGYDVSTYKYNLFFLKK